MVQWLKCIMFLTRIWVLFQAPMSGWLQLDLIADFWKQVPLSFLCRCLHPCTHLHTDACTHINKKILFLVVGLFNQHIIDTIILLCALFHYSSVGFCCCFFFWCLVLLCCLGFIKILFLFLFEKGVKFQWIWRKKGSGRTWGSRKIWSIYLNLKLFSRMSKTKNLKIYL